MNVKWCLIAFLFGAWVHAAAGERAIVSLRDFKDAELKSAGFQIDQQGTVHIKALGGGGNGGWMSHTNRMFAYGWIINADTRMAVWTMSVDNTSRSGDDREFDGTISLSPGSYEVYFTAYAFAYQSAFTQIMVNVDHRQKPLFGTAGEHRKNFFSWFTDWWSDDISRQWDKRSPAWGIDLLVDENVAAGVKSFTSPKAPANVVFSATSLGENELVRKEFSVADQVTLRLYAIGEGTGENEMVDHGWIVDAVTRKRVWEMGWRNTSPAGGADKNLLFSGNVSFPRGEYVLYYITDGSHSMTDWNDEPPSDPLNWGITISAANEQDKKAVKVRDYNEDENVIVSLTKARNDQYLTRGFTLKKESKVRIYAFGERNNAERTMADYGTIMDANTRNKVWTMDVDYTYHGGGASKNRFVDEVITLPRGNYLVTYTTDDSHAYGDWNDDPPFDPDHYGISVMGAGTDFDPSIVSEYVEQADKNVIAQIIRVGNNANLSQDFTLPRTTRVRVYALGEGRDRDMYDYGWIEDAKTGNVLWEMTYAMTFYAGGGRKNRMVNTTIMLDKGEYRLRYRSDDSHSYGDWNVDPPDDQQYWGITLYRDEHNEGPTSPKPPLAQPPSPPR